jgi:hypothetical protein
MGFPLDRGSVEDGILTCHWHHARFELASGCTFDLWADDVPTCPVEIRAGDQIWVKPVFGYANPAEHWCQRLEDGLSHNLSLVIAKAVLGLLAAGQSPSEVVRQAVLFGTRNRWLGYRTHYSDCARSAPALPVRGGDAPGLVSRGAAGGCGLRWRDPTPGAGAAGKSTRPHHPKPAEPEPKRG